MSILHTLVAYVTLLQTKIIIDFKNIKANSKLRTRCLQTEATLAAHNKDKREA